MSWVNLLQIVLVIGGSQYSGEKCRDAARTQPLAMGMLGVGPLCVFMIGCVLFSGAIVNWFAPGLVGGGWPGHALQLAAGSAVMGGMVALLGNLFLCRHAIRWGVLMPLMVLVVGSLVAMFAGRAGALELFLGVPLLSGVAVAGGLVTSFLVNGVLRVAVAE